MQFFSPPELEQRLAKMRGKNIAVIGDLMVDRYVWGKVVRISPEAPVPVVEVESESETLGGAANVSNNVHALGATAIPIGVIGDDMAGKTLLRIAETSGFRTDGIIVDVQRPTTMKTRIIAHNQHVVRVDRENKNEISPAPLQKIIAFIESIFPSIDAVILEDYNKGLLTPVLIEKTIALAHKYDVLVTVDPKLHNFFLYRGVHVFKPNRKETEEALATQLRDEQAIVAAAGRLLEDLRCQHVLITLGEKGMLLRSQDGEHHTIPSRARNVHDVSGAGDTVIGTLTTALAAGATMPEAAMLANFAAGVVVGEIGAVPISPERLRTEIQEFAKENQA